MINFQEFIVIYLIGGFTFLPLLVYIIYVITSTPTVIKPKDEKDKPNISSHQQAEKSGWIRLTNNYKPKGSEFNVTVLMSGIQSYVQGSKRQKELVYAQLKCNALFIYGSNPDDQQQQHHQQQQVECKLIIPVHNYDISLYPEKKDEQDVFGKATSIRLSPKNLGTDNGLKVYDGLDGSPLASTSELYITCLRPIDKEDWYFGLLAATDMMAESPDVAHVEMIDRTHFDPEAIQTLISAIHQDANYRQVQWLNAILGRLFLGLYKTDEIKELLQEKILKKVKNVKLPSFLGEITVQSIDIGNSIPFVTQPKLLSLSSKGDLTAEAVIDYTGGLRVVIQTDFNWTYSSLMKPIRVPLVLSVTLKSMAGKLLFKVKPPPTNRCWIAFYEMPQMEWEVSPIVSDKQIRFSMVTNAIQSKIREFIAENIVLPNMDDIPFCSSKGKGGIFGNRIPKPSSPKPQQRDTTSSKQSRSNQDFADSIHNDRKKSVDTSEISEGQEEEEEEEGKKEQATDALFESHSLSACGTESMEKDSNNRPEMTRKHSQVSISSTPIQTSPGIFRARGYSSPELILSESIHSTPLLSEFNESPNDTVVSTTSARSSRASTSIGFKKRQLSSRKSLASNNSEGESYKTKPMPPNHASESKLQIDDQEPTVALAPSHFSDSSIYDDLDSKGQQQEVQSASSSSSSSSSAKSVSSTVGKTGLFFKFGSTSKQEKRWDTRKSILNTKKDELYSIANNIFKKSKNQTKDEKNNNNKIQMFGGSKKKMTTMMTTAMTTTTLTTAATTTTTTTMTTSESEKEQMQSNISTFPPPVPPRRGTNPAHYTTFVPDNSSSSLSDEELSATSEEYNNGADTNNSNDVAAPVPVVSKFHLSDDSNSIVTSSTSSSSLPRYDQRIETFSFS